MKPLDDLHPHTGSETERISPGDELTPAQLRALSRSTPLTPTWMTAQATLPDDVAAQRARQPDAEY